MKDKYFSTKIVFDILPFLMYIETRIYQSGGYRL